MSFKDKIVWGLNKTMDGVKVASPYVKKAAVFSLDFLREMNRVQREHNQRQYHSAKKMLNSRSESDDNKAAAARFIERYEEREARRMEWENQRQNRD